jgi:hypothetical protein
MDSKIAAWLFFRGARWLSWIAFLGWSAYFHFDRAPHLNSFGHLLPHAEALWFGLATMGIFAGFFETMMRSRAGLAPPAFLQLIPPKATALASR